MNLHFLGPEVLITIILASEKDMGNVVDFGCWPAKVHLSRGSPSSAGSCQTCVGDLQSSVCFSVFSIVDYRVAIYRLSILLLLASLSSSVHLVVCAVSL